MKCLLHVRFQLKRSKVKVTRVIQFFFLLYPLDGYVPINQSTLYLAQILSMMWQCVAIHFQLKITRSHQSFEMKVSAVIRSFGMSALWLHRYLAETLHMWHTYNTWGDVHHFQDQRSKVKVTHVIRSFCPVGSMASSIFDWVTWYVAYIQTSGGSVSCTSFCHLSPLLLHAYLNGLWWVRGATVIISLDLLVKTTIMFMSHMIGIMNKC